MGYKVIPQWRVGHYRIDLVVESNGKRIAIECDGDKFHPVEKLTDDMARQAVLERLGWRFIRIRGSQFFRDPDRAMATVLEKIGIAGIRPEAEEPSVNAGTAEGQELVQRLVRNARELRRQWRELDGISMPRARPPARGETIEQSEIPVGATPDGVICDDEFGDCEAEDVKVEPNGSRLLTRDIEAESVRGAIYSILSVAGQIDREELLRQAAQKLGFARISKKLRGRLNKTIGAEVRYGRIRMDSDGCCSCTQESSLCFRSAAGS